MYTTITYSIKKCVHVHKWSVYIFLCSNEFFIWVVGVRGKKHKYCDNFYSILNGGIFFLLQAFIKISIQLPLLVMLSEYVPGEMFIPASELSLSSIQPKLYSLSNYRSHAWYFFSPPPIVNASMRLTFPLLCSIEFDMKS